MKRVARTHLLWIALAVGLVAGLGAGSALAQSQPKSGLSSLDANDDGVISREEAAAAQARTFHSLDKNGDGRLSRTELEASQPQPADGRKVDPELKKTRAKALRQWVRNLDRDDSGDIDLKEYQAGMTPYFDRLDSNGDGVIDGHELSSGFSTPGDGPGK